MIEKISTTLKFKINGVNYNRTEDLSNIYWFKFQIIYDTRWTYYKELNSWICQHQYDKYTWWKDTNECDIPFMELEYQKYIREEKLNRILNG